MGCDDTLGAADGLCERPTVGSEVVGDLVSMPCFAGLKIVVTEVVGLVDVELVECSDDTISTNETISSKNPTIGVAGCFVRILGFVVVIGFDVGMVTFNVGTVGIDSLNTVKTGVSFSPLHNTRVRLPGKFIINFSSYVPPVPKNISSFFLKHPLLANGPEAKSPPLLRICHCR